jgi:hypothetical protein
MKLDRHFFEILRTRMENILRALSGNRKAHIIYGDTVATDVKNTVVLKSTNSILPGKRCSLAELYVYYKACTSHEGAHIRYTSLKAWREACDRGPAFQHLTNIIEDGRIEAAISEVLPGAGRWIKFNNHYIFKHRKDYGTGVQAFLMGLAIYSVVGKIPKIEPESIRLIKLAAPYVDIGKAATSTEEVLEVVEEILNIPEIKELFKSDPPDPIEGDKGTDKPEKTTPLERTKSRAEKAREVISRRKECSKGSESTSEKPAIDDSLKESKDSTGTSSTKSEESSEDSKSDGKSDKSIGDDTEDKTPISDDSTEDESTESTKTEDKSADTEDESAGEEPEAKDLDEPLEESPTEDESEDESSTEGDATEGTEDEEDDATDATEDETTEATEEEVTEATEEEDAEDEEYETTDATKEEPIEEDTPPVEEPLDAEEEFFTHEIGEDVFEDLLEKAEEELSIIAKDVETLKESELEYSPTEGIRGIHDRVKYHEETLAPSAKYETLRKNNELITQKLIEEIRVALETKKSYDIRGLNRGRLHTGSLYKLAIPDPTVFSKKTLPGDTPELAVFVLVDLSGSMDGNRIRSARNAACVLSETCRALKITHKISGFSAGRHNYNVYHYKAVDWESTDSSPIDNFIALQENRDGYSIRIATNELLMRAEPKKVLFMLSDGSPCHGGTTYMGDLGENDTRQAALEAKKKGVNLISLFFGSSGMIPAFQYMYDNPVYVDDLNLLPIRLGEVFKKVLLS